MLLGVQITIHTDHRNILNIGDLSQRRLRWISYVDDMALQSSTLRDLKM